MLLLQLFHRVDYLLSAGRDKRLELGGLIRCYLTGHLTGLGLELRRFRLQRRHLRAVASFDRLARVNVVASKLRIILHKRVHIGVAELRDIVTQRAAANKAARGHKGENHKQISN